MGLSIVRPEFVPDPSLSREEMEALQREITETALFEDALDWPVTTTDKSQPVVAGIDQAFNGDQATSAIVVMQDGEVLERAHATAEAAIPYIPGLLSFREGNSICNALERIKSTPDLLLVDGSGRIHFREAGLATHIGVTVDCPAIGVAKSLLCGTPTESLAEPLPEGTMVPIEADDAVTAPNGTVIGYAVQTRQYDSGSRYINPLYVSPGHRVSAETAASLVQQCTQGYKLPEPIRLADQYAGELTSY